MGLNLEYGDKRGVMKSISHKINKVYGEDNTAPKETSTVSYEQAKANGDVKSMISCKLRDMNKIKRSQDPDVVKGLMQLPIREIQKQYASSLKQRDKLESDLDNMLSAKREDFYKERKAIAGVTEQRATEQAEELLDSWMEKDPDYHELSKAYTLSKIQFNSVLVAKQNWIDSNKDIIDAELQRQKREELLGSGSDLLEELGLKPTKASPRSNSLESDDDLRLQAILEAE